MSGILSLFSTPCEIFIDLHNPRRTIRVASDSTTGTEELPVFLGNDAVSGVAHVKVKAGKKLEHTGIRVQLIGQIELFYDRSNPYEFTSVVLDLEPAGTMPMSKSYPFEFKNIDKVYESYNGLNVKLRYFVRVTCGRNYASDVVKESDFWVMNLQQLPEVNNPVRMEVGIEDSLHIEFEYTKTKYDLREVVVGKIYFLLVRIKIKNMEISIIRRESTGSGPNLYNESETVTKYEVMDGAPVRGESIPIRMFLGAYDLTPTYKNVNNKFSVRYHLNLVLVDEEDRRYFKQQEIVLLRNSV